MYNLSMIKIDHFYIKVTDLKEAIDFYEQLLSSKISNREGDRWADFENKTDVYFGILNTTIDNETFNVGDNVTLSLKTDEIEQEHNRISNLNPKTITEVFTIKQPALYKYFQFEDKWGNIWEVSQYDY